MKTLSPRTAILTGLSTILLLGIYIAVQRVDLLVATVLSEFLGWRNYHKEKRILPI